MDLEMLPEAARVGVGLITAPDPARVGFVRGVDMHVLLPIRGVGEPPITALNLTLEGFFSCKQFKCVKNILKPYIK